MVSRGEWPGTEAPAEAQQHSNDTPAGRHSRRLRSSSHVASGSLTKVNNLRLERQKIK